MPYLPPLHPIFYSDSIPSGVVVYFRTNTPVSPSEFVHSICSNTLDSGVLQSRWTNRLTPIERTGKATVESLEEVARIVLKPHFHEGQSGVRFAIRPTIRNHNILSRELVINTIAKCVGREHQVDLKAYDVLILVEVYKVGVPRNGG